MKVHVRTYDEVDSFEEEDIRWDNLGDTLYVSRVVDGEVEPLATYIRWDSIQRVD